MNKRKIILSKCLQERKMQCKHTRLTSGGWAPAGGWGGVWLGWGSAAVPAGDASLHWQHCQRHLSAVGPSPLQP